MPDIRVQCEVEVPEGQEPCDANALRALPDGGDEFLLDFIDCPDDAKGEVVARLRVHRSVLEGICARLRGSVSEPRMELISVPLGG
jgi:hypothetical protein